MQGDRSGSEIRTTRIQAEGYHKRTSYIFFCKIVLLTIKKPQSLYFITKKGTVPTSPCRDNIAAITAYAAKEKGSRMDNMCYIPIVALNVIVE